MNSWNCVNKLDVAFGSVSGSGGRSFIFFLFNYLHGIFLSLFFFSTCGHQMVTGFSVFLVNDQSIKYTLETWQKIYGFKIVNNVYWMFFFFIVGIEFSIVIVFGLKEFMVHHVFKRWNTHTGILIQNHRFNGYNCSSFIFESP